MAKRITDKRLFSGIIVLIVLAVFAIVSRFNSDSDSPDTETAAANSLSLKSYEFSVSFIDVNQGDCELIVCEDIAILVDGGESEEAADVLQYLNDNGVSELDYYILSHPHSDHIGASAQIIDSVKCDYVVMTDFSENNIPTTRCFEDMLDACEENGVEIITVGAGDVINADKLELKFYAPFFESEDYNDMSLVFTASYMNSTVLFTGDTGVSVERDILEEYPDISADVIKIAHHGSSSSSCREFIEAVSPDYAVISCGSDNKYGHPHKETTALLNYLGIEYKRTDNSGTVIYCGDGNNMIFTEYCNASDN